MNTFTMDFAQMDAAAAAMHGHHDSHNFALCAWDSLTDRERAFYHGQLRAGLDVLIPQSSMPAADESVDELRARINRLQLDLAIAHADAQVAQEKLHAVRDALDS